MEHPLTEKYLSKQIKVNINHTYMLSYEYEATTWEQKNEFLTISTTRKIQFIYRYLYTDFDPYVI